MYQNRPSIVFIVHHIKNSEFTRDD